VTPRPPEPTPLQAVLQEAADVFEHLRVDLSEDEQAAALDILLIKLARAQADRLDRERRRAA
jgi:hypothetical protein